MMSTVVVDGDPIGGNVDKVQFRVGRDGCPRRDVAGVLPGIIFPGLMTEFSWLGNYIEFPFKFAGASIIAKYVTWHVFDTRLVVALLRRVTHHDGVIHDNRR